MTVSAAAATTQPNFLARHWRLGCWLAVLVLGAVQAWDLNAVMDPDGVSYLDMGDAFFAGNWSLAINGVWPPLYPLLIGATMRVLQPPPGLEIPVLHGVNWLIYLAAYAACLFLVGELARDQARAAKLTGRPPVLSETAWVIVGTGVFLWAALGQLDVANETPDMLAAVFTFTACALLVRLRRQQGDWRDSAGLGVMLGLAALSKYVWFNLALVVLVVVALAVRPARRGVGYALLAAAIFLLVTGPFVAGLSAMKGSFTITETDTYNYLRHINDVPYVNWQGNDGIFGPLLHPTRQFFTAPDAFEFAEPIDGTYPPWSDPAYWYAGARPRINLAGHLDIILNEALPIYFNSFIVQGGPLLVATLVVHAPAGAWRAVRHTAAQWVLLVPALATLAMLSIIHVSPRYLGAAGAVLWLCLLAAARPVERAAGPTRASVVIIASLVTGLVAAAPAGFSALSTAREWVRGRQPQAPDQWAVADALHDFGIAPGDQIAFLGNTFHATAWARLARVQIVAEIPSTEVTAFWALEKPRRARLLTLLGASGAEALVTKYPPSNAPPDWQRLGTTDYYALPLP